jgi:hypothetical protein
MALFPLSSVLRVFPRACPVKCEAYFTGTTYDMYASAKTLCLSRRSLKAKADAAPAQSPGSSTCPEKTSLISELET